ncbi:MAG: pilus assembly protein PilM [Candidatus Omnitrophota bacterium]
MARRVFGIDIGTSAVKLTELNKVKDSLKIVNTTVLPFDVQKNIPKLLKGFLKKQNLSRACARVTIPAQAAFTRLVKLPLATRDNLDQVIKYETQQQVPFPLEEIIWGYQVCDTTEQDIYVLIIAVKKVLLDEFIALVENSGFSIEHLTVGTVVLDNLFKFLKLFDEKTLILDLGHKTTDMIISDKNMLWTRTLPLGGLDIEENLSRELSIDIAAARNIKEKRSVVLTMYYGKEQQQLTEEQKTSQAISSTLFDICNEVLQSVNYYRAHYNKQKVFKRVILLGGVSRINNLDKFLASNLNLDVLRINLAEHFLVSKEVKETNADLFSTSLGSILGKYVVPQVNIDLLPKEVVRLKRWKKKLPYLAAAFILLGVFVMQLIGYSTGKILRSSKYMVKLSEYETYLKKQMPEQVENDLLVQKTRHDFFYDLAKSKAVALEAVNELSRLLPAGIWFEHLEYAKEKSLLKMTGTAGNSFTPLIDLKNNLERSKFFTEVKITEAFHQAGRVKFSAEVKCK